MLSQLWSILPTSLLPPASSGLQAADDITPPGPADAVISSPALDPVEHVPSEIRKLVCETCWRTLFSPDAFQKAWTAQFASPRDGSAAFSYNPEVLTWTQKQCRQLLNSRNRCEWCRLICKSIEDEYRMRQSLKHQMTVRFSQSRGAVTLSIWIENHGYDSAIYATDDDPAARYIPGREILSDVNSTLAYDMIKKRISGCSLHEHCTPIQRGRLPTRVIDCSDPRRPRLFITHGAEDHYVALSYVWGEKQPHRTTTKNLESYTQGIPFKRIPKTIMDAITVTRKLGFHYLWVDSFCIIQDSKDDKAQEIARIRHIFHDSYVTIIAACATKVSDGFLHDRGPTVANSFTSEHLLPFRCPDGNIGTMRLPVDSRAWCLEERVLSPRRLVYARHTLLYECHTVHDNVNEAPNFISLCATEDIPRIPIYVPESFPASELAIPDENLKTREAWYNIVTLYTQRDLTKPRDRLLAISGIAEHFQFFWPRSRYLAGLWEHQLPCSLLWHIPHIKDSRRRPDIYRAPSWSWASIDGVCDSQACTDVLCTIVRCDVTPARLDNPFGEVVGGYLVLEAVVQPAVWEVGMQGPGIVFNVVCGLTELAQWTERWEYDPRGVGCAERDAIEPVSEGTGNVYITLMCKDSECVYGLVLVPEINQTSSANDRSYPVFRRVGWFSADLHESIVLEWLSGRSQYIEII
ncbi:heterokaryon incompatibility protein-domain-containing protein [Armillaria novae-zelandiae]|uniref:Heterokaryon incompatibility protein-domain-containing protein n=1 Tax=Armillaria novae-zelandiae TaxID=153914 RepID=A0AA39PBP3_9AGAR|nr:heterokaryon incompatibility protein-domain-containing protein [Armillaria novae-zelandiae]